MPTFVQIAVNIPAVSGVFDYALPVELEGRLGVGHLVTVPFSRQVVQGVVLRFIDQPSVQDVKTVIDLLDEQPALTAAQIALAETMAMQTLNPLAAMVGLMLPTGLSQQADVLWAVDEGRWTEDVGLSSSVSGLSQTQKRIMALIEKRGSLRGRQIDRHFKNVDWRPSARKLVEMGILRAKSVLPKPRVRPKYVRTAQLAVEPQAALDAAPSLGSTDQTLRPYLEQARSGAALPDP